MERPVYGLQLVKNYVVDVEDDIQLKGPAVASEVGERVFSLSKQTEEIMAMIAVDNNLQPVGFFEVARGALDEIISSPREILKRAITCNAHGFFLLHNHNGSGECELSEEDLAVFNCMKKAEEYIGIKCMDLIAVGEDGCTSSQQEMLKD